MFPLMTTKDITATNPFTSDGISWHLRHRLFLA